MALVSSDSRISVTIQQVTSRFKAIQSTSKEILKKCEISVNIHKSFMEKYDQCVGWITAAQEKYNHCVEMQGDRNTMSKRIILVSELLSEKNNALSLLNTTVEYGEKLYTSTGEDGREAIRLQLEDLQQTYENLFDNSLVMERELKSKKNRWSTFEEAVEQFKKWLKDTQNKIPDDIELKATLDEKRAQLQIYRMLLHDIVAKQQYIIDINDKAENLPERSDKTDNSIRYVTQFHQELLNKMQSYLERYEAIVRDHHQYSKAVLETQEWFEATHNTIDMWGQPTTEHITLRANIEKLRNLQLTLPEEEPRIQNIRTLGERVIPGTIESGQVNIRSQIDSTQQEWQGLLSAVSTTIESMQTSLNQWAEFESLKDEIQSWLRNIDNKLHAVNLKETQEEKRETLEVLKKLQGEVRAKELEMDQLTEKSQLLGQGNHSTRGSNSQISEISSRYQQISSRVKDMQSKWHQYAANHTDYNSKLCECHNWLQDINKKLTYCSSMSASSQDDLEKKMEIMQGLILYKEEGFKKVQVTVELAQMVLANTSPTGHDIINMEVNKLQEEWSSLASKLVETKTYLDETVHRWAGYLDNINQLSKTVEQVESTLSDVSQLQTTLSEKRAQIERLKAQEMLESEKQSQAASQAQNILKQFENLSERIKILRAERETQYRDHRHYKEAYDDLLAFVNRTRDKIPALKQRNLGDRFSIEAAVQAMNSLLTRQAQGQILVDQLLHKGEVFLHSTSSNGQEMYKNEMQSLKENFEELFKDIAYQKENLEKTVVQWRDYKDEYEKLSDWLQKADADMKAYKTILYTSIGDKTHQVKNVKDLLANLERNKEQMDKLNTLSESLQDTHLNNFVQNQMRHLNSRYQVQVSVAKDVLRKVETTYDQHRQYESFLNKAKEWIDNAQMVVRDCTDMSPNAGKEALERHLEMIQSIIKKQEEGQVLVHQAVNWGEKVRRNNCSEGRDNINEALEELQNSWDKLIKTLSNIKVNLETNLLEWTDMAASYTNMQQWISEKEAKLQQLTSQLATMSKKGTGLSHRISSLSIGERKANLRRTTSIVQDIVSFEPMIESVTSKATESQTGQVKYEASEISSKYQSLSKQAKELLEMQKEMVDQHQSFVDAGNDFMHWLRAAKERMAKCAEPTGDKDTISGKATVLKILQTEQEEGQEKLDRAFALAELACSLADDEDKDVIEEEIAFLQEEFDTFLTQVGKTKNLLEMGIVKWTEYEDKFRECEIWLADKEARIQTYNKLYNTVLEKRAILEEFQAFLQNIFDWQKTLDLLNMRAQLLLETCADSRVSNAVTHLTTKYNTLLSLAKEVMRRLEMHYQEHQQHDQLFAECSEWIEQTRISLEEARGETNSVEELHEKLACIKNVKNSLEQGQHKLRYVLELKERVILNTEKLGANDIENRTDNIRKDFEKLMSDIYTTQQVISTKLSRSEETEKMCETIMEWLEEIHTKTTEQGILFSELSDKRAGLEKYKILNRDIETHADMIGRLIAKQDEENYSGEDVQECMNKYKEIKALVTSNIFTLEKYVKDHEIYCNSYCEATEWLRKTRQEVQVYSDSHGEEEAMLERKEKQEKILKNMPEGEEKVSRALKLNKALFDSTSTEGQEVLHEEMDELNREWNFLRETSSKTIKTMNKCMKAWEEFNDVYDSLDEWMVEFETQIIKENEDPTPEDLDKWKKLLEEVNGKKMELELVNDRCEILMEYSAYAPIRDQAVQLQAKYSSIIATLQSMVVVAQKSLSDHTEFVAAEEEFRNWLSRARGTIQECQEFGGSEEAVKDKLETAKVVFTRLTEGQHMLSVLSESFTRAISLAHSQDQEQKLRKNFSQLKKDWDYLNLNLTSTVTKLKAAASQWQEFREAKFSLESWLTELEELLADTPDSKGEVAEMRTLLEKYKNIHHKIDEKENEVENIVEEAEELSEMTSDESLEKETEEIQEKWDRLKSKCVVIIANLKEEIKDFSDYQSALQETEKWLLQISFQLMAENSLYICNKEQAEEQIEAHSEQLEEILAYQSTLDEVKKKGHLQIDRYIGTVPSIQDKIEQQLHNIQESYNSLLSTAKHIEKRLNDSLTWHNKLLGEKSRLAFAVQACEAATASVSRPGSPQDLVSRNLPEEELIVRSKLEDLIDQVIISK
ncbi:Nesprin-1 [Armadillidium nasatum]|uniref:Nesprin-1 n=1 Tax=Armadillidium nasatum TaxID=96803 RepID=A0A5N5TMY6_9CRUS|nr:Nesprin-1 [Armadillidium nasatum]